jgi:phosphoglycerate kinase
MQTIEDINFQGKRALIRVDFNVPLDKETKSVTDDTRIKAALPTINYVLSNGGSVVLMSHLGRPKSGFEEKYSLQNIIHHLSGLLKHEVKFAGDCIGEKAYSITQNLSSGEVALLDNLRFYSEETQGDKAFAEKLSKHGDIYINDAFGTAHRAHASTAIIAGFFDEKVFGKLMAAEIKNIEKVLKSPDKPLTAIIGGAKVSSKIGIIEQLVSKVDHLIIGGGMAYTFWKAKGGNVGDSLVEDDYLEVAQKIMNDANAKNVSIDLPIDTVIADEFSAEAKTAIASTSEIPMGWMGLDIGPKSIEAFSHVIKSSKTILWNGPMGVFEMEKFSKGTVAIALATVDSTKEGAYSLVGGGDSVAAINKFNLADKVSYVSTGGGAMLEYLEGKVLPGIEAIAKQ